MDDAPVHQTRGDQPPQAQLPFDEVDEQPVPFALTARARRTVAPGSLPDLRVVAGTTPGGPATADTRLVAEPQPADEDHEDPSDTRPARARALRRAGARPVTIARQLGVSPVVVRTWTDGVHGVAHVTALEAAPDPVDDEAARAAAFASARTAARREAVARLHAEPVLAAGAGVLAGRAVALPDGVTLTTDDPRVAAVAIGWCASVLDVAVDRWRMLLRLGERTAADLARHRWAGELDRDPAAVRITRWAGGLDPDGEELRLRLADPVVAAAIAGWGDAALELGGQGSRATGF